VRQNHQLLRVQNYSAPIVKSGHYFSDLSLPPVYWRKRNIARRFYSSMPFSEKRDLHLFVRFIHETFSRAHRTDLHLFIRMFTAAFQPIFHLTLSLSFPLFLSIFFTLAPFATAETRNYTGSRMKHLIDIVAYHVTILFSITAERLPSHG